MISGDDEDTAKTENDDSLFRPSVTERSSPGSFEPATDSKGRNHMVRSLNLHICPSGSGSQEGTPPDRSYLATVHSSLSTFCILSDDFRQTEPCQEISAGWSFHEGKNFLITSKDDQTSPQEEDNIRGDQSFE